MKKIFAAAVVNFIFCAAAAAETFTVQPKLQCQADPALKLPPWVKPPYLAVDVKNSSGAPQSVSIDSCSYDRNFRIDAKEITIESWNCKKNGTKKIELKPGSRISAFLPLTVKSGASKFRVGFSPEGLGAASGSSDTSWSWSAPADYNCK